MMLNLWPMHCLSPVRVRLLRVISTIASLTLLATLPVRLSAEPTVQGAPDAARYLAQVAAERTAHVELCSMCHDANLVAGFNRLPTEWDEVLVRMQSYGTVGAPEQFALVRGFLLRSYGKVNINTAPAADLAPVMDLQPEIAEAVVAYRTEHGEFKSPDDLKNVAGIDPAKIDARKNRILVVQ